MCIYIYLYMYTHLKQCMYVYTSVQLLNVNLFLISIHDKGGCMAIGESITHFNFYQIGRSLVGTKRIGIVVGMARSSSVTPKMKIQLYTINYI